MKNIVIYTCIIGNYDQLLQPKVIDSRFDYICFVRKGDKTEDYIGVWKIEELEYLCSDNIILSRYPKLNPHIVLSSKYDFSLWIDGNIYINHKDLYDIILDKVNNNIIYSGIKHWGRNCIYEESLGIILGGKANLCQVLPIVKYLIKQKFPRNFGLAENNVIFRKHKEDVVVEMDTLWWKLFLRFCKRDQMSFSYSIFRTGIKWNFLLPDGYCARDYYVFGCTTHSVKRNGKLYRKFKFLYNYINMIVFRFIRIFLGYKKLRYL